MLHNLSKKDKYWREIAFKISGCKSLADDLVQEMYLRRYENDRGQQWTDYYIICTIRSIFLNQKKTNKLILVDKLFVNSLSEKDFELSDEEYEIMERFKKLPHVQRELLELSYDYSLRQIQDKFNINYGYVYKLVKQAREIVLGNQIGKYKNKRLKFKKMAKSKGLGDTVEKILKASGIKKLVELTVGDDCGCKDRQEALNKFWQYKLKPQCFTPEQLVEYKDFILNRKVILTGKGKAKGRIEIEEMNYMCELYSMIFQTALYKPDCTTCAGTAQTLVQMIYRLDTVYYNNLKDNNDGDN